MSRYIDAEKVMEEIYRIGGHNLCEWETIGVKALIARQPTADVVEVVRCKDCVHGFKRSNGTYCCKYDYKFEHYEHHYCSYGERNNNEGNL